MSFVHAQSRAPAVAANSRDRKSNVSMVNRSRFKPGSGALIGGIFLAVAFGLAIPIGAGSRFVTSGSRTAMILVNSVLFGLPVVLGLSVWGRSRIAAVHLIQVGIYFGLGALASGELMSTVSVSLVVVWVCAVGGVLLSQSPRKDSPGVKCSAPTLLHAIMGLAITAMSFYLVRSGTVGLAAQISNGVSAAGAASVVVSVAPLYIMSFLIAAVARRRYVVLAIIMAFVHLYVMALVAYRGAGFTFAIATILALLLALPSGHSLLRKRTIILVCVALGFVGFFFFQVGANSRAEVAEELSANSEGTRVVSAIEFIPYAIERTSLGPALDVAVVSEVDLPESVSWRGQAVAIVPRFVYPDKPVISYGIDIAHAYYGQAGNSASTLTWLGDLWVNGGVYLVVVAGVLYGTCFRALENRISRASSLFGIPFVVSLAWTVGFMEGSIPRMVIDFVRDVIYLSLLWAIPGVVSFMVTYGSPRRHMGDPSQV